VLNLLDHEEPIIKGFYSPSASQFQQEKDVRDTRCIGRRVVWKSHGGVSDQSEHNFVHNLTDYILKRATWHVTQDQVDIASYGAAAGSDTLSVPSSTHSSHSASPSHSTETVLTKEVAMKVIPKNKVKGNEASVLGEMEVLKGLCHPNIVGCVCSSH
jgi:hypothetical protein